MTTPDPDRQLFAYGTLQLERVQKENFGRVLAGKLDQIAGFKMQMIRISDLDVIAQSGQDHHPILQYTGNKNDIVAGTVFEVTRHELELADAYEVDDYERQETVTESGRRVYLYVSADSK